MRSTQNGKQASISSAIRTSVIFMEQILTGSTRARLEKTAITPDRLAVCSEAWDKPEP
jgi:hypothetical protein